MLLQIVWCLGSPGGSYKHLILFLPVPESMSEFIGAIQRREKKGGRGQPCTQTRASLLRKSFSLPVVLTCRCFVAPPRAGFLAYFLTNQNLTCLLTFSSTAILLRGRFPTFFLSNTVRVALAYFIFPLCFRCKEYEFITNSVLPFVFPPHQS